MIDSVDVIRAYEDTGVTPKSSFCFQPDGACAAGVYYLWMHNITLEDALNSEYCGNLDHRKRAYELADSMLDSAGTFFYIGFDDALMDRPVNLAFSGDTYLNGYQVGKAVKEWYNNKTSETSNTSISTSRELAAV